MAYSILSTWAYQTSQLVEENVTQYGLGQIVKSVTFRPEDSRGAVLQSLKDRADRIIRDLENRTVTGLAAMDLLSALVAEKEEARREAQDTGLSPRAFGVYWNLKNDPALRSASISAAAVARDAESLLVRFPNASVNPDERRKLRAALYRPLLGLGNEERAWVVDLILSVLLDGGSRNLGGRSCQTG